MLSLQPTASHHDAQRLVRQRRSGVTSTLALASLADAATVVSVTARASPPTPCTSYVVPEAKAGDSVIPLSESALKFASEDPARVTVTVYVCVVSPSCAVTTTAMTLPDPTTSPTTPSWSTTPLSFTSYAAPATTVAVTVVSVTLFATDAVYVVVPDANTGVSVTPLSESALSVASADLARVTVTV